MPDTSLRPVSHVICFKKKLMRTIIRHNKTYSIALFSKRANTDSMRHQSEELFTINSDDGKP